MSSTNIKEAVVAGEASFVALDLMMHQGEIPSSQVSIESDYFRIS